MRLSLIALTVAFVSSAASAHASDPCNAISEDGQMPSYLSVGSTFTGPVVHVIDGDSMCVAVGAGHENWVEVRLADFFAPESSSSGGPGAKAALERIALGKTARCTAGMGTFDRIAARCTITGQGVGDQMRRAGVREGGNGLVASGGPQDLSTAAPASSYGSFRSCAAARAAGAAPLYRGASGYNPRLDADGDGVACEPMPRR